ncbi:MAG: hypothetical protein H6659_18630 [Ardenticatenaceae bacterium]|nr:hypothetical protein [Ardenticatenaceae bacterium]
MKEKGKETTVSCVECRAEHPLEEFYSQRQAITDVESGVTEIGLLCPDCGRWVHAFYQTPHTKRLAASITRAKYLMNKNRTERSLKAYRRAVQKYQEAFDELQARLRIKVGMVSPTETLGRMVVDIPKVDD